MPKRAVSVTLDVDNLTWLRAQGGAGRNVSRIVNELVSEARAVGRRFGAATRSVAGTVDLRNYDPGAADRQLHTILNGALRGSSATPGRLARSGARRGPAGAR